MVLSSRDSDVQVNDRGHVKISCPECKYFDGVDWCEKGRVHVPAGYFCLVSPAILARQQKRE